jgi:nicotinic acid mononucleotide adenylyltransferase
MASEQINISGSRAESILIPKSEPNLDKGPITYGFGDKIVSTGNKHAVFSFGRFQPPTTGHAIVISTVADAAASDISGADAYIFPSSSQNNMPVYLRSKKFQYMLRNHVFWSYEGNENPLSIYQKIHYLKLMHGQSGVRFINTTENGCRNMFAVIDALVSAGYERLSFIVGSDRVKEFTRLMKKLPFITVLPAGVVRTAKTMSGTKMRAAAVRSDFETFKAGVITGDLHENDALAMMRDVRVGLGLLPEYDGEPMTILAEAPLGGSSSSSSSSKVKTRKARRVVRKYTLRSDEKL